MSWCEIMTEKHPFEDVLKQISDTLHFIQENFSKGTESDDVAPEILTKLKKLEEQVDDFKKRGDHFVSNTGVSQKELENLINISSKSGFRVEDRLLLNLVEDVKGRLEQAQKEYSQKLLDGKDAKIPEAKEVKDDGKFGKKRQKKFKRFGSNDKWKPL